MLRSTTFAGLLVVAAVYLPLANALTVNDDEYGIPGKRFLKMDPLSQGVLNNDSLNNGEVPTGTAVLVSGPGKGSVACPTSETTSTSGIICENGAFNYTPIFNEFELGPGQTVFDGSDSFQYRVDTAEGSATATVTLTACEDIGATAGTKFACWNESAFINKINSLTDPIHLVVESFDGAAFAPLETTPMTSITNKGVTWTTNFSTQPDNKLASSSTQAVSGLRAIYDQEDGYTPVIDVNDCNGDNGPPLADCPKNNGITATGPTMNAIGGYINSTKVGGNISIFVKRQSSDPDWIEENIASIDNITIENFFGLIDINQFTDFKFQDIDGVLGDNFPLFFDRLIIGRPDPVANTNPYFSETIPAQQVNEGGLLTFNIQAFDDEGDGLTYEVSGNPVFANLLPNQDGSATFSWTPASYQLGSYTLRFTATDDQRTPLTSAEMVVSVTVTDSTVVVNDNANTTEDVSVDIDVLVNDTDTDAKSPVASVTSGTNGAMVTINTNGTVNYAPATDFNGTDGFTYTNDEGNSGTVTVTVTAVDDPTTVVNDTATTTEGTAVDIDVLANDIDVDSKSPVVSVNSGTIGVTVTINTNGTVSYTPATNFNGTDSFTYTNQEGASGTVTVNVTVANDPTTVMPDSATTVEDTALDINVLANDTDIDTKSPVASVTSGPNGAMVTINTNGTVNYAPATDFNGTDSFTYTNDEGNSGTVTVTVTAVDDPTTVLDDTATTSENTPVNIDVIANDTDVDSKSPVVSVTSGSNGATVTVNTNGTVNYVSAISFNGIDSFTYTNEEGNSATVTVTVTGNKPPTVIAPANIVVDSIGRWTPIDLGVAQVVDDRDADLVAQPSLTGPFKPGRYVITWNAEDREGLPGFDIQTVEVRPLVAFFPGQYAEPGEKKQVKLKLNHKVTYPVNLVLEIIEPGGGVGESSLTINANEKSVVFPYNMPGASSGEISFRIVSSAEAAIGEPNLHKITILDRNVEPSVHVQITQAGLLTQQVTRIGGLVTVKASVFDPNSSDTHKYDWSKTDNVLLGLLPGDGNVQQFTIDPSLLDANRYYKIRVKVSEERVDGSPELGVEDERYFKVLSSAPILNGDDSDEDGTNDETEGFDDDDEDNIPDYADAYDLDDDESELIPGKEGHHDKWLINTQPGTRVRLGPLAQQSERNTVHVTADEIKQFAASFGGVAADPIDTFTNVGGYFNFEIDGITKPGQSVNIVIPVHAAIPENAVYRKYFVNTGWQDFVSDTSNKVYSAPGDGTGVCPAPGSAEYREGLYTNDWCLQLLIEDGGANDGDGEVNGSISDPGGIATTANQSSPTPGPSTSGGGGGGGSLPIELLVLLLLAFGILRYQFNIRKTYLR